MKYHQREEMLKYSWEADYGKIRRWSATHRSIFLHKWCWACDIGFVPPSYSPFSSANSFSSPPSSFWRHWFPQQMTLAERSLHHTRIFKEFWECMYWMVNIRNSRIYKGSIAGFVSAPYDGLMTFFGRQGCRNSTLSKSTTNARSISKRMTHDDSSCKEPWLKRYM